MTTAYSGDGITFPDNSVQATAPRVGMVNRVINGDMRISQRNGGASVNPASGIPTYIVDRFYAYQEVTSKFTVQQNAGSVTPPTGFTNYLGVTSSSAYSATASQVFQLAQPIEGFNVADLGWGTANAATVTLTFQVYSSLTGTFGGSLRNSTGNRSYPFTYTISTANTWTSISITVAGDTTGTWPTTNGASFSVIWSLGTGTTFQGTAGAWAGTNYLSATGATSVVGTSGATFYITGVQLEKGSTATDFEYVDYSRQLQQCQRYCVQMQNSEYLVIGMADTISTCEASVPLPVEMRTAPTLTTTATAADYGVRESGTNNNCTSVPNILGVGGKNIAGVRFNVSSAFTTGQALYAYGNSGGFLRFEAEL